MSYCEETLAVLELDGRVRKIPHDSDSTGNFLRAVEVSIRQSTNGDRNWEILVQLYDNSGNCISQGGVSIADLLENCNEEFE